MNGTGNKLIDGGEHPEYGRTIGPDAGQVWRENRAEREHDVTGGEPGANSRDATKHPENTSDRNDVTKQVVFFLLCLL